MAVDSRQKRTSMISSGRRLPWFRRFTLPVPDSSVETPDRAQLASIYSGLIASSLPSPSTGGGAGMLMMGVGGGGGFSPLSLNPTLWALPSRSYSDNGSTLAVDNDPTYLVDDATTNNNDPIQTLLANRPTYKSAGYWQFDGTNDSFSIGTIAITLPVSCYAVVDTTNLGTSDRIFLERSPAATSSPAFYLGQSANNYKPYVYWNGNHATGSAIQGLQIVRWKLTSTNAYTKQNDNAEVDGGAHGQTLGSVNWTGINSSSTQQSNINLYEMILYNGVDLDGDDDAAIFNYLNGKYSVY